MIDKVVIEEADHDRLGGLEWTLYSATRLGDEDRAMAAETAMKDFFKEQAKKYGFDAYMAHHLPTVFCDHIKTSKNPIEYFSSKMTASCARNLEALYGEEFDEAYALMQKGDASPKSERDAGVTVGKDWNKVYEGKGFNEALAHEARLAQRSKQSSLELDGLSKDERYTKLADHLNLSLD
jgi:hypothetical protein